MASGLYAKQHIYIETLRIIGAHRATISSRSLESYRLYNAYAAECDPRIMSAIRSAAGRGRAILDVQARMNVGRRHPMRMEPDDKDDQALTGYRAASEIMELVEDGFLAESHKTKEALSVMQLSMKSVIARSRTWLRESRKAAVFNGSEKAYNHAAALIGIIGIMEETRRATSGEISAARKSYKDERKVPLALECKKAMKGQVALINIGTLNYLKVKNCDYLLTNEVVHRIKDLLERVATLLLVSDSLGIRKDPAAFLIAFFPNLSSVWDEDPYMLGAAMKAARQMKILSTDYEEVSDPPASVMFPTTLSRGRRRAAKAVLKITRKAFRTVEDEINFLGMYKGVMLCDLNPADLITEILGTKDANKTDPNMHERFEGTARRALYESMRALKISVTSDSSTPASSLLHEKLNSSQVPVSSVTSKTAMAWSGIRFSRINEAYRVANTVTNPGSKSSSKPNCMDKDSFKDILDWSRDPEGRKPEIFDMLGTINDMESVLTGESQLDLKKSIAYFERVISAHEAFESSFESITDITSEELSRFVEGNPKHAYVIATEPKLGEFHKVVTRTFYMAEQKLKCLTQAIERLVKQLSRKQKGVSIVKGYAEKRKELEDMCNSMTGAGVGKRSVYVSFDMAEFSKKFPGELLRIYGKILSELTGEAWLARIDVIFRSAIIYMSTRGHADYISGVTGAFEGFLNFTWSSIHAIIMEVALESTGCPGSILVYSDDGLLKFIIDAVETGQETMERVVRIQEIYRKLGLNFHMAKNLVSFNLWEYLGEFCRRGRLLDSWVKELSSFTRSEMHRGLLPLTLRKEMIISKAEACVKAGFSNLHGSLIATWGTFRLIISVMPDIRHITLEMLAIIPTSCGGFRVRSISELGVTSKVSTIMEFQADLSMYEDTEPHSINVVCTEIRKNLRRKADRASMIIRNTYLSTTFPDVSGNGISHDAISSAREHSARGKKLVGEPITKKRLKHLDSIAKQTANIVFSEWATIVQSSPDWKKYAKSLSMVSGAGALRLVPRGTIKSLQRADTIRCISSMKIWESALKSECNRVKDIGNFIPDLVVKFFSGYSIGGMYKSARILLVPTKSVGQITVTEDFPENGTMASMEYREPRVPFPSSGTTLSWFSEASGATDQSGIRSFLDKAARFLVANPDTYLIVTAIASVFGLHVPHIPNITMASLRRRVGQKGTSLDVLVPVNHSYVAGTNVLTNGAYSNFLYGAIRADRTTLREYARLAASIWRVADEGPVLCSGGEVKVRNFVVDHSEWKGFHYPPEQKIRDKFDCIVPVPPAPRHIQQEFKTTISEYASLQQLQESLNRLSIIPARSSELDKLMLLSIQEESLVKWLNDVYSWKPYGTNFSTPMAIPSNVRTATLQKAILRVALQVSSGHTKSTVRRTILGACERNATMPENVQKVLNRIHTETVVKSFEELFRSVTMIVEVLEVAEIMGTSAEGLSRILEQNYTSISILIEILNAQNLFRTKGTPLVIIRPNSAKEGMMSVAHRNAFKTAFTIAIDNIIGSEHYGNLSTTSIAPGLQFTGDEVLDYLYLFKGLVRESTHRNISHPYNRKTALISMIKVHDYLRRLYRIKVLKKSDKPHALALSSYRLSKSRRLEIVSYLGIVDLAEPFDTGYDHNLMLDNGIPDLFLTRALHHWNILNSNSDVKETTRKRYNKVLSPSDINRELSALYTRLIAPASRSIIEYPRSLQDEVSTAAPHSIRLEAELITYSTTGDWVNGTFCESAGLTRYEGAVELFSVILECHAMSHGVVGYMPSGTVEKAALAAKVVDCARIRDPNGHMLGVYDDRKAEVGMTSLFMLQFDSLDEAAGSFHAISTDNTATAVIVKLPDDSGYAVAGIISSRLPHRVRGRKNKATEPTSGTLEDLLSPANIRNKTMALSIAASSMTGGMRTLPQSIETSIIGTLFARVRYEESEVNTSSVMLQIASDIVRDSYGSDQAYQAYLAMMCAFSGNEVPEGPKSASDEFVKRFKSETWLGRRAIMADVTGVVQWLTLHPVTMGPDLNEGIYKSLRNIVSLLHSSVMPPLTMNLENPITYHELVGKLGMYENDNLVGRLGSILCDNLSEEEESRSDEDIDGMFGLFAIGGGSYPLSARSRRGPPEHATGFRRTPVRTRYNRQASSSSTNTRVSWAGDVDYLQHTESDGDGSDEGFRIRMNKAGHERRERKFEKDRKGSD